MNHNSDLQCAGLTNIFVCISFNSVFLQIYISTNIFGSISNTECSLFHFYSHVQKSNLKISLVWPTWNKTGHSEGHLSVNTVHVFTFKRGSKTPPLPGSPFHHNFYLILPRKKGKSTSQLLSITFSRSKSPNHHFFGFNHQSTKVT